MSGTSVDGIDAVLLDISRTPPKAENRRKNADSAGVSDKCPELPELTVKERAFITLDYPEKVRQKLLTLAAGNTGGSEELCVLNFYLGELFADACFEVCKKAGVSIGSVDFIGSHGHTVFHAPQERLVFGKRIKSTLQIGEGAVIAERTGCVTVSDFRVRDTAAGGFGAPLVPFSEYLLYRERGKVIALQNIGGIGNITILPADENINGIIAFDTGPGNMIIDGLVRILTGGKQNYDKDGAIALRGKVDEKLLGFLKKIRTSTKRRRKRRGGSIIRPILYKRFTVRAKSLILRRKQLCARHHIIRLFASPTLLRTLNCRSRKNLLSAAAEAKIRLFWRTCANCFRTARL